MLLAALLFACGPRTVPYQPAPEPQEPGYLAAVPAGTTDYDNGDLAALFVRLTHRLEDGGKRETLQRFEAPVRVGITGPGAENYRQFLEKVLADIRSETGIDISSGPPPHNMLIRLVPGEEFLPGTSAQCFILFAQPTWAEFISDPRAYSGLTETLENGIQKAGIMIPDTIEPYKVRECLLEEITQALGPANDLYGLASSIFNDDDAHTWPTKLDYLMLRVLYDERLKSGLPEPKTARLARTILDDLNPSGRTARPLGPIRQETFSDWRLALHRLTDTDSVVTLWNARRIAEEAEEKAPGSAYHCTGAMILAFVSRNIGARTGAENLDDAMSVCTQAHGADDVRLAALRLNRAYGFLDDARYRRARDEFWAILPIFVAHGQEDEIADAKIGLARAALGMGEPDWVEDELAKARIWSAYAFGADHAITEALNP